MKGKILGTGAISGADGARYYYDEGAIKNAKDGHKLEGCEVDFEVKDGKAIHIYITKSAFSVNDATQNLLTTDLQSIKLKAFIMMGCVVLMIIPILGFIFGLVALVLYVLVVLGLHKASQSTSLLKNWILSMAVYLLGVVIIAVATLGTGASLSLAIITKGYSLFGGLGVMAIFSMALGFLIMLSSWYFSYLYYKEVAYITNEPFFMYYFWCALVGTITLAIFIGGIILLVGAVLWIIAWVKTQELRQSYSAVS